MSVLWDIWRGVKSTAKSLFSSPDNKEKETLNQQIDNWTVWQKMPTRTAGSFSDSLNQQAQQITSGATTRDDTPDPATLTVGFLDPRENVLWVEWDKLVQEENAKNNRGFWKTVGEWAMDFWDTINQPVWTANQAKSEYNDKKQYVALGYDRLNWKVLYLNGNDNVVDFYSQEFNNIVNNPDLSPEELLTAMEDFYQKSKDGFKIEELPAVYNSRYNQDTIDRLAWNNVTKWNYTPTREEFFAYLNNRDTNANISVDISAKYAVDDKDKGRDVIDLTADASSKWFSNAHTYTDAGIVEKAKAKLNSEAAANAVKYYNDFTEDQLSRFYQRVSPVYIKEQIALAKAPSERNEWDWYIIDTANICRRLEKQFAVNMNNWMSQVLDYWTDDTGNIVNAIDRFEWWESLWQVLTKWMLNIAGMEEWALRNRMSALDIAERIANDGLYHYNQANISSWWRRARNWAERAVAPVWRGLAEWWQIATESLITLWNVLLLHGRAPSTSYLNQDASIGKLIETDDGNIKRTVKKYVLQLWEYAPEGIANLAPDILATAASMWWTAPKLLNQIEKWVKLLKGSTTLQKIANSSKTIAKWIKGLEKIEAVAKDLSNVNKWWKVVANIVDRAVTQWAVWQTIDAQWSAFDTEPYSDASFALSALWSLWFDILPELTHLKGAISKPLWSVRNLVDYMESSPEALDSIAKALWKKNPQFSFDEIKQYSSLFWEIEEAAKKVWDRLPPAAKEGANKWTKELMYNYVKQTYGGNSTIAKNVRQMLWNGSLNPADVMKYVGLLPWDVSFGPYTSSIRLKNWTRATVRSTEQWWLYDAALDSLEWGFDSRVRNWFTDTDLETISTLNGYKDVVADKEKYFTNIEWKYYLTEDGLDKFHLSKDNLSLESLWISIASAENTRDIFKNKMKNLADRKVSDATINALADSWGYEAVVKNVKEILWC